MPESNGSVPELSVILPGYNERAGLRDAIDCYRASLPACGVDRFEIIIVDDASTDGMGELADALARDDPRIRVVHHERNLGQVAGILNGFRAASGRILTHNGVDLPFHPRDTGRVLACFQKGADGVVVERTDRQSYGLARRIISWGNILLLRILFATPFYDHNFVQFFRREVIAAITVRSSSVSTVTPELIFRARRQGFHLVSLAAEYQRRRTGKSTINARKVVQAFWQTLKLWRLMRLHE